MTRIAIPGSMQFHNKYVCSSDVEGHVMGVLAQMVVDRLNKYGAPTVQAQRFWTTNEDGWTGVADGAASWGDLVVAFHTDSAGNQDNDGRGYTGSVLCFKGADQKGRRLGWAILNRMLTDFGWVIHREEDRSELYMFRINDTPACLLELGNHSDPDDCRFMLANLDKFADSIAWGIFEHLGINPRKDTKQEDDMQPVPLNADLTKWQTIAKAGEVFQIHVSSGDAPGVAEPQGDVVMVQVYRNINGAWVPRDIRPARAGLTIMEHKAEADGILVFDSVHPGKTSAPGASIVVQKLA